MLTCYLAETQPQRCLVEPRISNIGITSRTTPYLCQVMWTIHRSPVIIWTPTTAVNVIHTRLRVESHRFEAVRHWSVQDSDTGHVGSESHTHCTVFVRHCCYLTSTSGRRIVGQKYLFGQEISGGIVIREALLTMYFDRLLQDYLQ